MESMLIFDYFRKRNFYSINILVLRLKNFNYFLTYLKGCILTSKSIFSKSEFVNHKRSILFNIILKKGAKENVNQNFNNRF